jgi:nitroreductase
MDIDDIIKNRRTIRRFEQKPIDMEILKSLVDCARLAPSGANRQPLEYIIVQEEEQRTRIFECLSWAGYIAPAGNPPEGFRPMAYIIVVGNSKIRESGYDKDIGAAVENILISAFGKGIASCWIGTFTREEVIKILCLPEYIIPHNVIALGYPAEESTTETFVDSAKYWKDDSGNYHVPKRSLESILHINKYTNIEG